jgi:predicted nucleic acid-binding protein
MNIIVDTNVIHKVFVKGHEHFEHYASIYRCLIECKGKMIVGGTTFLKEIDAYRDVKYTRVLNELKKAGKLIVLPIKDVDKKEKELKLKNKSRDFDDAHLIACIIIADIELNRCTVLCTEDKRADKYIKDQAFYSTPKIIPSIYRNKSHIHLIRSCCN